jgi:xanthosine phosphorylase
MTPTPHAAAAFIRTRAQGNTPRVAFILGSGLGVIAENVEHPIVIAYDEIPGFPRPSVDGHSGRLVLGRLAGVDVVCLQGRVHPYEGVAAETVRLYVRALKLLGCEILLLTNAAGSLRPEAGPGSLMMLTDHINLLPFNPLVGPNDAQFGPRFPALDHAYDRELQGRLRQAARGAGITLHEGVYLACLGPSFETPAEIRAYQRLGADAVGMSTVPEVIVACHCGLRVAAVSAITNLAVGLAETSLSHEQTLTVARQCAEVMERLVLAFLSGLARSP